MVRPSVMLDRGNLSTTVSRFGRGEILSQSLAQNALRRGLERGLLALRQPREGRRRSLQLGLQLRRLDHHGRHREVEDRRAWIAEAGWDADDRRPLLAGAGRKRACGADRYAAAPLLEAGKRLLVVAAVGRAEHDALGRAQATASDDLRGELSGAVRDAAHVDGPVRHARRLDPPQRIADLLGIGEHVLAPHRTSSPGAIRAPGPTTAPAAT